MSHSPRARSSNSAWCGRCCRFWDKKRCRNVLTADRLRRRNRSDATTRRRASLVLFALVGIVPAILDLKNRLAWKIDFGNIDPVLGPIAMLRYYCHEQGLFLCSKRHLAVIVARGTTSEKRMRIRRYSRHGQETFLLVQQHTFRAATTTTRGISSSCCSSISGMRRNGSQTIQSSSRRSAV